MLTIILPPLFKKRPKLSNDLDLELHLNEYKCLQVKISKKNRAQQDLKEFDVMNVPADQKDPILHVCKYTLWKTIYPQFP